MAYLRHFQHFMVFKYGLRGVQIWDEGCSNMVQDVCKYGMRFLGLVVFKLRTRRIQIWEKSVVI